MTEIAPHCVNLIVLLNQLVDRDSGKPATHCRCGRDIPINAPFYCPRCRLRFCVDCYVLHRRAYGPPLPDDGFAAPPAPFDAQ